MGGVSLAIGAQAGDANGEPTHEPDGRKTSQMLGRAEVVAQEAEHDRHR